MLLKAKHFAYNFFFFSIRLSNSIGCKRKAVPHIYCQANFDPEKKHAKWPIVE